MNILGIESSCDDTAASVLTEAGVLSNVIASQSVHIQFGGVVPELASRAHHQSISQTVDQALSEAQIPIEDIDGIAVTQGPGLMGSLLVGLSFAKGLALNYGIPLLGVNHMDAHIYANAIEHELTYPFIALTVSGGHTQLTKVTAPFEHHIIGKTRDDAAGEAFDKIGKILGLAYPAGPKIDALAQTGDPNFKKFPQGLVHEGLDFSFSGLKTSVLYYLQDQTSETIQKDLPDICASVSEAITEVLVIKLERAMEEHNISHAVIAGGVSANRMLREKINQLSARKSVTIHSPSMAFCTDNGAMIAQTGALLFKHAVVHLSPDEILQRGLSLHPYASQPSA